MERYREADASRSPTGPNRLLARSTIHRPLALLTEFLITHWAVR